MSGGDSNVVDLEERRRRQAKPLLEGVPEKRSVVGKAGTDRFAIEVYLTMTGCVHVEQRQIGADPASVMIGLPHRIEELIALLQEAKYRHENGDFPRDDFDPRYPTFYRAVQHPTEGA